MSATNLTKGSLKFNSNEIYKVGENIEPRQNC